MTHSPLTHAVPPFPADVIPTLSPDMTLRHVPEAVSLALDVRTAEKQALMDLSGDLVQNLRPEIERLTTEMVQRTLQGVWDKRSRTYHDD